MDHSDEIIGLYKRHALAWAKKRSRGTEKPMEAAWLDRFMSRMPSRPAVLDIGCGSGEPMSRYLAEHGCTLTGVDSSSEMIALYESALPRQSWRVADMRSLSLGATFDGILAWHSFFHLRPEDQRRMFPIFRTHASPGAALMFTAGPGYGVAMGTFEGEPLYHASLDADEYSALLNENGFALVTHMVEDETCGRHTIWLAQRTYGDDVLEDRCESRILQKSKIPVKKCTVGTASSEMARRVRLDDKGSVAASNARRRLAEVRRLVAPRI